MEWQGKSFGTGLAGPGESRIALHLVRSHEESDGLPFGHRRCLATAAILILFTQLGVHSASAQVAATVRGVVRDGSSGAPVAAALLSIDSRQALTSTDGTFRFLGVPPGTYRLRVEAIGYRPLEQNLRVAVGMAPLELRLDPDPIQLRELTVTGNARAAVRGVVLNARSGEPLPWTDLTLTRGATQDVGRREASNEQGVFDIANIPPGEYLLRVERLGFVSQYVPVSHAVPPLPVEVRLEPDSALLRGLGVMNGELALRRDGHGGVVRAFDEKQLRLSRAAGMRHFLDAFTPLALVSCGGDMQGRRDCVAVRGRTVRPRVFVDEILVFDPAPPPAVRSPLGRPGQPAPPPPPNLPPISMDVLDSYDPRDFHSVEYFECPEGGLAAGRLEMHVYTYEYMTSMARRPRIPMPACLP